MFIKVIGKGGGHWKSMLEVCFPEDKYNPTAISIIKELVRGNCKLVHGTISWRASQDPRPGHGVKNG